MIWGICLRSGVYRDAGSSSSKEYSSEEKNARSVDEMQSLRLIIVPARFFEMCQVFMNDADGGRGKLPLTENAAHRC